MLLNKNVLITGSTSGIGLEIATFFAKNGANIVLNGLGPINEINTIIENLSKETTSKIIYSNANLMQVNNIEKMFDHVNSVLGSIDILINNAGMQHVSPIESFPCEKWDQIISLNLSSAFHTTRLALPDMRKKGWGRIINIASVHGLVASIHKSAYVAAKHGLIGLTKVTALETAKEPITCNAICPGWVKTPLVEAQIKERANKNKVSIEEATTNLLCEKQPSQTFVNPEQIAQLCSFLCSDAASQMTGTSLNVDGGWISQ